MSSKMLHTTCHETKGPHLANIHFVRVFARSSTVGGEDGGAVAVGVSVDQGNGLVQIVSLQDDEHRSKDLLPVARHVRLANTKHSQFMLNTRRPIFL